MAENSYPISMECFVKAAFGTYTILGTARVAKKAHGFKVESDTVFTKLEVNSSTTDVRSSYLDTVGGTVPKGTIIVCGEDNIFSAYTLASGAITLILAETDEPSL